MSTKIKPKEGHRKRHCWECLRRRIVCDSTRPACVRCSASGNTCPGYNQEKPSTFKWLEPGRVISRESTRTERSLRSERERRSSAPSTSESSPTVAVACVPRLELNDETDALFQAAAYYNTCILQNLLPLCTLGPNPSVYAIHPMHIQMGFSYPDHLRLNLICMTMNHRINRIRDDPHHRALARTAYHYRGKIIRSLSQDIDDEAKRAGNLVFAGILTLLLADSQQGALPNWRVHLMGVQKLITLRGGLRIMARDKSVGSLLSCFIFLAVIGNTTSPAWDLVLADAHSQDIDFITDHYGSGLYSFQSIPPTLFSCIMEINHVRQRATEEVTEQLSQQAYHVLRCAEEFSPERWAESKPSSTEAWKLLGSVYQAAVTVYTIASLQSLVVLPGTASLESMLLNNLLNLRQLLEKALATPSIKSSVLWPLVALGAQADRVGWPTHGFVTAALEDLSQHIGTYVPLAAIKVLEQFWASGETCWDACFTKPYVFASQIALDLTQIVPS